MSESNMRRQQNTYSQKQVFNLDSPELPFIKPAAGLVAKGEIKKQDLGALCKNPRQSAELIRYLIEFIKSL
jgi:hypothetical protein